jgi:hypothetical protein
MDCEFDVDTLPQMSPVSARELPRVVYTPAFGLITGKLRFNLRCFRFFVFAMDYLPHELGKPGCEKWKSIQRDHHNTNRRCSSPMLWCTGLGSNSLTGSPKRDTNGCATYTYRCLPLLTTNPRHFWGRPTEFLFVIGLDAGHLGYSWKRRGINPQSYPMGIEQ